MAVKLYLNAQGTSIQLADGVTSGLIAYAPKQADLKTVYTPGSYYDAGKMVAADYDNITEDIKLYLIGSSSTIRTTVGKINRFLAFARDFARGSNSTGSIPKLYYDADSSMGSYPYYSYVLDGTLKVDENWLTGLVAGGCDATLTITRLPYFFDQGGGALTGVSFSNRYSAGTLSGIRVDNCSDSTHNNYAYFDASALTSDLPTYANITVTNNDATYDVRHIWVAMSRNGNPPAFLEAESATNSGSGTLTTTADGTCSNGNYATKAWSGTGKDYIYWTLGSPLGSIPYKLLVRFHGSLPVYTDWRMSVRVAAWNVGTTIWQGPQVLINTTAGPYTSQIVDLGTVRLPAGASTSIYVVLEFQRDSGGSNSVAVDYLAVVPFDTFRYYFDAGYFGNAASLVDTPDNYNPMTAINTGSGYLPVIIPYGGPHMLYPTSVTNQGVFTVFTDSSDGRAIATGVRNLYVTYQPRRTLV